MTTNLTMLSCLIGIAVGLIPSIRSIFASGGIPAFYNGVVPYLIGDGLSGAVKFATYERARVPLIKWLPLQAAIVGDFLAASLAFLLASVFLVPGETIKTLIQQKVCLKHCALQ